MVYWYEVKAHPGAGWHSRAKAGEFAWIVGQGRGAGGGGNVKGGEGVRVCVRVDEGGMLLGLGDVAADEVKDQNKTGKPTHSITAAHPQKSSKIADTRHGF